MLRFSLAFVVTWALVASIALAQDTGAAMNDPMDGPPGSATGTPDGTGAAATGDTGGTATTGTDTSLGDQQAQMEGQTAATQPARESTDPYEDEHTGYWFAGAFYRQIIVPTFMQRLFVEGGATASNPAFGLEATHRKGNFDITMSLWWAGFSFDAPYRASGDPDTDMELVNGNTSAIFASAAFMWSTPFNDMFALEYGLDVGLGVVLGHVTRTEAYPSTAPGNNGGYLRCNGVGDPDASYCDGPSVGDGMTGGQYRVTARKWTEGGSVPNIVPWLGIPHIALRFKPIHQLMMRLDVGFGLGFWFGGAINYGF